MKKERISIASENYLEVIYELSKDGNGVRSVNVAERLGVSKASVNKAVGVLRQAGMVDQQLYGVIRLTEQGLIRAEEVDRRHRVIKYFFTEIVGVDEETADDDACRMEHIVSDVTMRLWTDYVEKLMQDENRSSVSLEDIEVVTQREMA